MKSKTIKGIRNSYKSTVINQAGTNNKFQYRKPVKQAINQGKGTREECKVFTKEEIAKLYNQGK